MRLVRWAFAPVLSAAVSIAATIAATMAQASAMDVELAAPLSTVARVPGRLAGADRIVATVEVPQDAPDDLGVGAFVAGAHGRWYQVLRPGFLRPGIHRLDIDVSPRATLSGMPHLGSWSAVEAANTRSAGLVFWSATRSHAHLRVELRVEGGVGDARSEHPSIEGGPRLLDLISPMGEIRTGERWETSLVPEPMPANPYDPGQFTLEAVITPPSGPELRVAGFYDQPMESADRGDREIVSPRGRGRFTLRWRPRVAGSHRVRLEARWRGGAAVVTQLAPVEVAGPASDGYVRVDAADPRYFAVDGAWFWPVGPSLHAVWDMRDHENYATRLTPERITQAYHAYFARFHAAGATACEVWMSPRNLALEWREDWPGYHGIGRYDEDSAWRLDRVLDDAWANRMRVNLVVWNHGQASIGHDTEWVDNPYNVANGGPIAEAAQLFTDPRALAAQERLRRYVQARWADHPAILGWKLWSEVDLTAAGENQAVQVDWHRRAAAAWHANDAYGHPVCSHWCGDYRRVDQAVAALPGLDYLTIDAYTDALGGLPPFLGQLLRDSMEHAGNGLGRFHKPILATEFGCYPHGGSVLSQHTIAPWAALVTGHAGAPMLWWFEWIDQGARWQPYGAIGRFLAGEDARGADARAVDLQARGPLPLWSGAWSRPGHALGYVVDARWGTAGGSSPLVQGATVRLEGMAAGPIRVAWWDPDAGEPQGGVEATLGDDLSLSLPAFSRHLAFKITAKATAGVGHAGAASAAPTLAAPTGTR